MIVLVHGTNLRVVLLVLLLMMSIVAGVMIFALQRALLRRRRGECCGVGDLVVGGRVVVRRPPPTTGERLAQGEPKLLRHHLIEYRIDGRAQVVGDARDVRHDGEDLHEAGALRLVALQRHGHDTLGMEWRVAEEEGDHHGH